MKQNSKWELEFTSRDKHLRMHLMADSVIDAWKEEVARGFYWKMILLAKYLHRMLLQTKLYDPATLFLNLSLETLANFQLLRT